MAIEVETNITLDDMIVNISRRFNRELKRVAVDEVRTSIESGISPVRGFRRFKQYTRGYASQKGVPRQLVDMTLTGKMLSHLRGVGKRLGRIEVKFNDKPVKGGPPLSVIHNEGLGRQPARRLLPTKRGETFKDKILNRIVSRVNRIVIRETAQQNR